MQSQFGERCGCVLELRWDDFQENTFGELELLVRAVNGKTIEGVIGLNQSMKQWSADVTSGELVYHTNTDTYG